MERTEVLDMMSGLKLYGMRNAYDETLATALKRKHEPQRFVGDLLKAEISEKQARSIKGMPGALDVGAEPQQRLPLIWGYAIRRRGAERIEFVLKPSLLFQALVPPPLQFAGDQPVIGIDSVILPSSMGSLETRLLESEFDMPALLGVFASALPEEPPEPLRRREAECAR